MCIAWTGGRRGGDDGGVGAVEEVSLPCFVLWGGADAIGGQGGQDQAHRALLGLSLRRARAVHPVDAYHVEYSLFEALAIEGDEGGRVLDTCRELGVTVFACSPLGRGVLRGKIRSRDDLNGEGDLRQWFPRFSGENLPGNLGLVGRLVGMVGEKGCTVAQLSLAWLMAQEGVVPIPGTRRVEHLEENVGAVGVEVTAEEERLIRKWVEEAGLVGEREIPGMLVEFNDSVPL